MTYTSADIAAIIAKHTQNGVHECSCGTKFSGEYEAHLGAALKRLLGTVSPNVYLSRAGERYNGVIPQGYEESALTAWRIALADGNLDRILLLVDHAGPTQDETVFANGLIALAVSTDLSDDDFAALTDPVSEIISA